MYLCMYTSSANNGDLNKMTRIAVGRDRERLTYEEEHAEAVDAGDEHCTAG